MRPQEDKSLTRNWKKTIKVAVTGASGNIANHLLFMVRVWHGLMRLACQLGSCAVRRRTAKPKDVA